MLKPRACHLITFFVFMTFVFTISSDAHSSSDLVKECALLNEEKLKLPPSNVFEFIQNIKYGIEDELFLQECFFDKNNLMRFANSSSIEKFGANPNWLVIKKVNINGIPYGMEAIRKDADKEVIGRLSVDFYPPLVTADYIIKVFGPIIVTTDPYEKTNRLHPMPLVRSTHLYGNLKICQLYVEGKSKTEVCSLISSGGLVNELHILQTREK